MGPPEALRGAAPRRGPTGRGRRDPGPAPRARRCAARAQDRSMPPQRRAPAAGEGLDGPGPVAPRPPPLAGGGRLSDARAAAALPGIRAGRPRAPRPPPAGHGGARAASRQPATRRPAGPSSQARGPLALRLRAVAPGHGAWNPSRTASRTAVGRRRDARVNGTGNAGPAAPRQRRWWSPAPEHWRPSGGPAPRRSP